MLNISLSDFPRRKSNASEIGFSLSSVASQHQSIQNNKIDIICMVAFVDQQYTHCTPEIYVYDGRYSTIYLFSVFAHLNYILVISYQLLSLYRNLII